MARIAPAKAEKEMAGKPNKTNAQPRLMLMAAPNDAPLDTPSVKGVASGLRNMAWKTMPLMANAAPARNDTATRGTRRFQKTLTAVDWSLLEVTSPHKTPIGTSTMPTKGVTVTTHTANSNSPNSTPVFLLALFMRPSRRRCYRRHTRWRTCGHNRGARSPAARFSGWSTMRNSVP